jgi:serine/threonine-protein kinase
MRSSVPQGDVPTVRPTAKDSSYASSIADERFAPGTLLAERYRIVGRIGRGGMGEVYRADDLKLGQAVALKFLPEALSRDPSWLRRFHEEVRIAREVAHPNVCRVYDIGEVDGEHFIAMEFVDGEDLSALLPRIGRLPKDKGIEIARQLCAGIAAAHDKNVLHRDLKPANVMLDGRGRVRITDFGVAALAQEVEGAGARAGTPAYMAPEQLAGERFTRRSDLYALGLVLYEIFTGREPYAADTVAAMTRMRESGPPSAPSSFVEDMDPLVERVILRCLEHDPADRPPSAIAVAAALPGGDPVSMALAAGETPSPEMVAESGAKDGARPAVALGWLAGVAALCVAWVLFTDRWLVVNHVPLDKPPAVLVERAREIQSQAGYPDAPADEAHRFWIDNRAIDFIDESGDGPERWDRLATGRPRVVGFTYRSAPAGMVPRRPGGRVAWADPPFDRPGMCRIMLDGQGRLLRFDAVPPSTLEVAPEPAPADYAPLFEAAGLDAAAWTPVAPEWTPLVPFDTRVAWVGAFPEAPDVEMRIEAGSFAGVPVHYRVIEPFFEPRGAEAANDIPTGVVFVFAFTILGIPAIAGLIALRNVRAGRGDRRGAARLAACVFAVRAVEWIFGTDAIFDFGAITLAFGRAAGPALVCWVLYLAVEPYARRHWPRSMISWTRLLAGRFRDPLVGRDVLVGCAVGIMFALFTFDPLARIVTGGEPVPTVAGGTAEVLDGLRYLISSTFSHLANVGFWLGMFVLLLVLRMIVRRTWLAVALFAAFMMAVTTWGFTVGPAEIAVSAFMTTTIVVVSLRYGLLTLMTAGLLVPAVSASPTTTDFSHWYAWPGLVGPLLALVLAAYAFRIALAGRPLFRDGLLEA